MQGDHQLVYWEKQEKDLMCGLHTLNSILQAPLFDEVSLANIGWQLDQQEQNIMENYTANSNVNDSGNFSIQVLIAALNTMGSFDVESIQSKENRSKNMSEEQAFVCHSDNHWFGIRKVHNIWFNLNSTNMNGPQIVSDFYLAGFLEAIQNGGYTIFVVRGNFQSYDPQLFFENLNFHQRYFELDNLRKMYEEEIKNKTYKLNTSGTDQLEMERVIKASMDLFEKEERERQAKLNPPSQDDNNSKNNFKAFEGAGLSVNQPNQHGSQTYQCDFIRPGH